MASDLCQNKVLWGGLLETVPKIFKDLEEIPLGVQDLLDRVKMLEECTTIREISTVLQSDRGFTTQEVEDLGSPLLDRIYACTGVSKRFSDSRPPLTYSCLSNCSAWGFVDAAQFFLQRGAVVDAYLDEPLHFAVASGNLEMARLLISNGAHASALSSSTIEAAISGQQIQLVMYLLANGAKISAQHLRFLYALMDLQNASPMAIN